jgi:hypothetical protein
MKSAGRTANSRFTSSAPVVGLRKSTDGQRSADHSWTARADRRGRFADLIIPTRPTNISLVMFDATESAIYIETEFCSTLRLQDRVGADGGISHAAVGGRRRQDWLAALWRLLPVWSASRDCCDGCSAAQHTRRSPDPTY